MDLGIGYIHKNTVIDMNIVFKLARINCKINFLLFFRFEIPATQARK